MEVDYQLSAGICKRLQEAAPGDEHLYDTQHTVQFLSIKPVQGPSKDGNSPAERNRVIMSDGTYFTQAMLATQLNHLVKDGSLKKHSVVVLDKLTCNFVQEKRCATRFFCSINVVC